MLYIISAFRRFMISGFGLVQGPSAFKQRCLNAVELRRSRVALANLSDDQLTDVGLTREDVIRECKRPFWDVTPWCKPENTLHGDQYLGDRPVGEVRSFYRERGRINLPARY